MIFYILMRGGFPFPGNKPNEVIDATLHSDPSFHGSWAQECSPQCIELIKMMLIKDPGRRITVDKAMCHSFFDKISDKERERMYVLGWKTLVAGISGLSARSLLQDLCC